MDTKIKDKAGKDYWDSCWEEQKLPDAMNPHLPGLRNLYNRRLDELLRSIFAGTETKGKKLLEVGCAMSTFLPYFAKEFDFDITGLDYSEIGCEQERRVLQKAGVKGEIVCADFFDPPEDLLETFDFVSSFGVAEHFIPTEKCLSAFATFLKPGGRMITIIPNMTGSVGWLTKVLNRPVYDIHVLLDKDDLGEAHKKAGLKVKKCDYFLSNGFGILNVNGLPPDSLTTKIKSQLMRSMGRMSVLFWSLEDRTVRMQNTKFLSPYIYCVADKI